MSYKIKGCAYRKFYVRKRRSFMLYRGFYWKPEGQVGKMDKESFEGKRLVKCIDCVKRKSKECNNVRNNKYESKPCVDYTPDLGRASRLTINRNKKLNQSTR